MPDIRIWLVGAGPGDPDLLTVKALRLIAAADIILHDALVTADILALAGPGAELIAVGKRAGAHAMPQAAINALLVAAARRGARVVRLKGGDPTLFGRLAEEMDALRRANLRFEVVPGVTAACAAAAAAQVSLTARGRAQSVTFLTGHAAADADLDLDWQALAAPNATLAVYMGKSTGVHMGKQLLAHGASPATPVLIVENAGRGNRQAISTDLARLADAIARLGDGPAITIVGHAVDAATDGQASLPSRTARSNPATARETARPHEPEPV